MLELQLHYEDPLENLKVLDQNYLGRDVLVGMDPSGRFWRTMTVMGGRSDSSRNRVYLEDQDEEFGTIVRTDAADRSKPFGDPENTIYIAFAQKGPFTVISNGRQTTDIARRLNGSPPEELGMIQKDWETEGPNSDYTSRISALVQRGIYVVTFGRIVRNPLQKTLSDRHVYTTELQPGYVAFISTYNGDGTTVPQRGDPIAIQLPGVTLEDNVTGLRGHLHLPNVAGIVGSEVDIQTGQLTDRYIWNAYQSPPAA